MEANNRNAQKILASFVTILAVVILTVIVKNSQEKPNASAISQTVSAPAASSPNDTSSQQASSQSTSSSSSSIKDGTYTAQTEYSVPHGYENISVTLTIKNGTVTDSKITNSEDNPESASYQEEFSSTYKSYVVGKNVVSLRVPYVSGASDTTNGFNKAVSKIVSQAQA